MLFDAIILCVISLLCLLMSSFALFLIVLHMLHSIHCLLLLFPIIVRLFIIRVYVVDDIIDINRFPSALATLYAWIMSVKPSVMVSMSSISCSV